MTQSTNLRLTDNQKLLLLAGLANKMLHIDTQLAAAVVTLENLAQEIESGETDYYKAPEELRRQAETVDLIRDLLRQLTREA